MSKRRVVVTGLGMLTSLGHTVKENWDAILAGKSGVSKIERFDPSRLSVTIGSCVKGFDPTVYLPAKEARRYAPFIQFAYAASQQAIQDAGIEANESNAHRIGVAIGAGIGGLATIEKNYQTILDHGPRRISPFFIPGAIINMSSGFVSIKYGFKGPNIAIVTACTTATHNIGHAARMIQYGDADVMVTGGSEMATTESAVGGFASARALSTRNDAPEKASRPWDKGRDGFVLGDGAGVLILEEYEHAKARGAKIYAELSGFGMSADAHHITTPGEDGAYLSMINTMADAGLKPEDIQYVNAHGTSTPVGDKAEATAIRKAFGAAADSVAVSSTKSMTGHLLGAAGAIEAIYSTLAIRDQIAPPTINLDEPDEGCDLDFVPHTAREMPIQNVLSNSFGFGGTNGSLIFSKIN